MSPVNSDDSSGDGSDGAGRPLTRKELRAREKAQAAENNSVVPEQAYQTGHDVPPPAQVQAAPADPPIIEVAPPVPAPAQPAQPLQPDELPAPDDDSQPPATAFDATTGPSHEASANDIHADNSHDAEELHEDAYPAPTVQGQPYEAGQVHDAHPESHADEHSAGHGYVEYAEDADYHATDHDYHPTEHDYHDADSAPGHDLLTAGPAVAMVSAPSKKVRRRRRLLALLLTLVVFVAAIAVGAQFLKPLLGGDKLSDFPGPGTGEVHVSVMAGEGPRSVATKLENGKVVANADSFIKELTAAGGTLSPGDYTFRQEMKTSDALGVLLGKDKGKVVYFALSAGLRIGESLQAISDGSGIPVAELKALSDAPAQLGVPATAKNLEGFLAPGEYRFPLNTPGKEILQSLVKMTLDELKAQGISDPAKQYDAVIVASIVQAEGGQAEYGDVAGAIYNRLKPNDQTAGFLQVDSAVTYGLGTKSFHFTDEQRKDASNPYNTYAHAGLPPGPIGSPGKTAIDAAAKPKSNDYLYWVTINLDTKETKFSKTLAEHSVYVAQYNEWCNANAGRCV
ncbi:endolytic transglycosylase MltG [Pseudarthrobacter sp. N5]|uniref:endolytic transglycosylase MltG n=1 Tax=Pseudarthrobacter sp. N5 TaxID=3418416 RepID=UPI003CF6D13F